MLAQYSSVNARANQTAATPFSTYPGEFVAPVNPQQTTGIGGINTAANEAQPYYSAAASGITGAQSATAAPNSTALGLAGQSAEQVNATPLTGQQIDSYLSPYLNTVLGSTGKLLTQQNEQAQTGALGSAIQSGAFGGDRTGIAAANLQQQEDLAAGNVYSGIANTGYLNAQQVAQQQQGVNLEAGQANRAALGTAAGEIAGIGSTAYGEGASTANTLAGLGAGAQSAALTGAQAQIGAGTLQQQTQQAQDAALYNQFLQQQSYPFQVDQFLANIAEGTGALSGSTTTTTQPGGFFSDRRLKHDIKKIGKLFDGQEIYSYKMHGDPRTHIGLIAQKVEKKHPEAVGLAAGYKTVDYGKATEKAANKDHFREGGVVPFRQKRAAGGPSIVDAGDLSAILQAQQQMYAPYSGVAGVYGSSGTVPRGGSSRVPAPTGATPHLVTAEGGLRPQATGLQNAKNLSDTANSAMNTYKLINQQTQNPAAGVGNDSFSSNVVSPQGGLVPTPDVMDQQPLTQSRGGRAGFDAGGMPYSYAGDELDIPDTQNQRGLAVAPALQSSQSSGMSDLSGIMKLAGTAAETYGAYAALAAAKRGGRIKKDVGGGASGSWDDPPDPDNVVSPQGVGKGVIDRSGSGLLYTRDYADSHQVPYAAPDASDPMTYDDKNATWEPPSPHGASGSWDAPPPGGVGGIVPGGGDIDSKAGATASWASPSAGKRSGVAPAQQASDAHAPINPNTGNTSAPWTGGGGIIPSAYAGDVLNPPAPDTNVPAQKQSWWDKIKGSELAKPENLIPLLSGIAAMGTAPTRHLGVAAAAGLGAGTQSYLDTRQKQAQIGLTGAETGLTQAQTGRVGAATQGQQIANIAELQKRYEMNGMSLFPDPTGTSPIVAPDGTHWVARPRASAIAGGSGAYQQPTSYNYLGKNGMQTAQGEGVRASMSPEAKAQSQKEINEVYSSGSEAQARIPTLQRWEQSVAANQNGPLKPGAMNEFRTNAVNYWNTLMDQVGSPENKITSDDQLSAAQMATKTSKGAAAMGEAANQQRSFNALKAFLQQTPNPEMQREAALSLIADLHMSNQQAIDKKNYFDEFDRETQRNYGSPEPGNYLARDAAQAFDQDHPSTNYQGERNNFSNIIQSGGFARLSQEIQNAPEDRKQKIYAQLDAKYGRNFHRYFTGSP